MVNEAACRISLLHSFCKTKCSKTRPKWIFLIIPTTLICYRHKPYTLLDWLGYTTSVGRDMDLDYLITFIKDHPNLLFYRVSIVRLVL